MEWTSTERPQIQLVGICVRTSYQEELDKVQGHIFPCVRRYFHDSLFEKIPNRKKPGTTFCAYTDYDSNYKGAYTYFIGEEVSSAGDPLPEGMQTLSIPAQRYAKFTTQPAPMPDVIVNTWKHIWNTEEVEGNRAYQTDFEIYDERAADHQNIVLDVYIGMRLAKT